MMSSSESEDLTLPIEFIDRKSPTCLELSPIHNLRFSCQASDTTRRFQNNDTKTYSEIQGPNGNKSVKSASMKVTEQRKKHRKGPKVFSGTTKEEECEDANKSIKDGCHSPDEVSLVKVSVKRMRKRRKRSCKGPVIFSDSESDENGNSSNATSSNIRIQSYSVTAHKSAVGTDVQRTCVAKADRLASRSYHNPRQHDSELFISTAVVGASSVEKSTSRNKIAGGSANSVQVSSKYGNSSPQTCKTPFGKTESDHPACVKPSGTLLIVEHTDKKVPNDSRIVSGDANLEKPITSVKLSPRKSNGSDNSADDLNAAEKSFYDCEKLKISRSRFGAFRKRKNYKFAPLIFAEENKNRGAYYHSKLSFDENAKGKTLRENPANPHVDNQSFLSSKRGRDNVGCESGSSFSDSKVAMQNPKVTSGKVGQTMEGNKISSSSGAKPEISTRSSLEKSAEDLCRILNSGKNGIAHKSNQNASKRDRFPKQEPEISTSLDVNSKFVKVEKSLFSGSNDSKKHFIEMENAQSPEKRKIYAAMNELFFGEDSEKVRPAPTRKRICEFDDGKETVTEQDSNEITLLDDDSLWSSSTKSKLF